MSSRSRPPLGSLLLLPLRVLGTLRYTDGWPQLRATLRDRNGVFTPRAGED